MSADVLSSNSSASSNSPTTGTSRTGVVIVHGAGIWQRDYWKPIVNAIQGCIAGTTTPPSFGAVGVCYSDVINSPEAKAAQTTTLAPYQTAFMNALTWDNMLAKISATSPQQLLQQIIGNLNPLNALGTGLAIAAHPTETILDTLARVLIGKSLSQLSAQIGQTILPGGMNVAATIQDVCLYLQNDPKFVQPIRQEVIDGLHAAQQYDEIVLVSHSLGTIVAFDVLNAWTESQPKIAYWFTLGCPLTKVLRLRAGTPNRLNNPNVTHWYNLYDTTDVVASPLGPTFTKPGYNIHDIFVDVGIGPVDSHDYFRNQTALRLIADALQATSESVNQ